jgi:hypothetical protein
MQKDSSGHAEIENGSSREWLGELAWSGFREHLGYDIKSSQKKIRYRWYSDGGNDVI